MQINYRTPTVTSIGGRDGSVGSIPNARVLTLPRCPIQHAAVGIHDFHHLGRYS